ncbi:MAG: hypothetical protein J6C33_09530 [Lachnospiraceae bacterium]|nr:hypothetical protein [Lachnospiraceae bacterium]
MKKKMIAGVVLFIAIVSGAAVFAAGRLRSVDEADAGANVGTIMDEADAGANVGTITDEADAGTKAGTIVDETGQEYSSDSLIISVAEDASEEDISAFLQENNLEIIYKMDNLKMYAVRLQSPMTADELEQYIAELEKNETILAVNKNYITHLEDPA